jgi:hypothetical protein
MLRELALTISFTLWSACERRVASKPDASQSTSYQDIRATARDTIDVATGMQLSCDFVTMVAHENAQDLAREFLRRDGAGEFLQSSSWFDGATDCPGHEPGPDVFTLVANYATTPIAASDSAVTIQVTYRVLGHVHGDASGFDVLDAQPRILVDTLALRHTAWGWRVRSPALWQRVLVASAIAKRRFRPTDIDRIHRLAAQATGGA